MTDQTTYEKLRAQILQELECCRRFPRLIEPLSPHRSKTMKFEKDKVKRLEAEIREIAECLEQTRVKLHGKIEELQREITNWNAQIKVMGSHRTCDCLACERFRKLADGIEAKYWEAKYKTPSNEPKET